MVTAQGRECTFVRMSDRWGIKVFAERKRRSAAYERQRKAAKHGLGPAVGDKFILGDQFCYVTEVAEPLVPTDQYAGLLWNHHAYKSQVHATNKRFASEMERLLSDMEQKTGYRPKDTNSGNAGMLDGRLVWLDFNGPG